jgi:hypothetical protein
VEYVNVRSPVGYRFIGDIAGHKENELYKKRKSQKKPEKRIIAYWRRNTKKK